MFLYSDPDKKKCAFMDLFSSRLGIIFKKEHILGVGRREK
jgi:hypothetical protein